MTTPERILKACPIAWARTAAAATMESFQQLDSDVRAYMEQHPEAVALLYMAFLEGVQKTINRVAQCLGNVEPDGRAL